MCVCVCVSWPVRDRTELQQQGVFLTITKPHTWLPLHTSLHAITQSHCLSLSQPIMLCSMQLEPPDTIMEALSHPLKGIVDHFQMRTHTHTHVQTHSERQPRKQHTHTARALCPGLYKITDHFNHLLSDSGQFIFSNVTKAHTHTHTHTQEKCIQAPRKQAAVFSFKLFSSGLEESFNWGWKNTYQVAEFLYYMYCNIFLSWQHCPLNISWYYSNYWYILL